MVLESQVSMASSDESEHTSDPLNLKDDEGWEDAEPDEEEVSIVSLFSDRAFLNVPSMLQHCKEAYDFDFLKVRDELGLDFLDMIKLVNYIRDEVKNGNMKLNVSSKAAFEDDRYLQPVLENDALLYSMEDVVEDVSGREMHPDDENFTPLTAENIGAERRIVELRGELQHLQAQFDDYRQTVSNTLDVRWDSDETSSGPSLQDTNNKDPAKDDDSHYFTSYSYNDIHEVMLKDTVRTDAYRNFIYDNKNLFRNKVVLDVGCGTGILSMFCARAGAAKVIAVDNSDIINKARENVFENGFTKTITCLRGKIEEVSLPVPKFDIIISEWMGYCLLYEAMLDSVLWARTHYLAPTGLMIPSHTTLRIAPLADPDYIADHISFWQSVYGFTMTSMLANIYDDVLIRHLSPSVLPATSQPFLQLPLHHTTTKDLTFAQQPFRMELSEEIDALDGFVIWFDTFFLPSRDEAVPASARAESWTREGTAFTTGPSGTETHWRQGVLLIDHGKRQAPALKKGQVIEGEIGYKKGKDNARELDIEISWNAAGSTESGKQLWHMR
ncbi:hypothetical protein MMC12_001607 [Toensbergia leucococca]|nr:hypothetical protein [Toensbergia leucococca]